MVIKKKKARWVSMILSVMMVFAFMPLITGPAYAQDGTTVIKTSEITDDMLTYRNDKGYLRVGHDTTLYVDSDITLHGLLCDDREYHYDSSTHTGTWTGSYYDLTIRGDGEHTLTILGDLNNVDAIHSNDIWFESGNVDVNINEMSEIYAENSFHIKGGSLTAKVQRGPWSPFYVKHKVIVSGGKITVTNNDTETVNAAILCGHFEMAGGTVRAEADYGSGIWVEAYSEDSEMDGNLVMTGGKLTAIGDYYGAEVDGMFVMTGGYIYGASKKTDQKYAPGIDFGTKNKPVIGGVDITTPASGTIKQYDQYGNPWYVADKGGNVATPVVIQPVFTKTTASLSPKLYTYNGKVKTPAVTVKDGSKVLKKGTDYTVAYASGRKNAGKYAIKVTGAGIYSTDTKTLTFTINKAKNPLAVSGRTATVTYIKVKNAAQKLALYKVIKTTKKGKGTVTYTKKTGNGKITIAKKTGKVTVKKGINKGIYTVKVNVRAAGTKNYKALTKTVTFKIKVK